MIEALPDDVPALELLEELYLQTRYHRRLRAIGRQLLSPRTRVRAGAAARAKIYRDSSAAMRRRIAASRSARVLAERSGDRVPAAHGDGPRRVGLAACFLYREIAAATQLRERAQLHLGSR